MTTRHLIVPLLSSLLLLGLAACEEDTKQPTPPTPEEAASFDLWIPVVGAQGHTQSNKDPNVILQVSDLAKGTFTTEGQGASTEAAELTPYVVCRDGYYYSISRAGYFGKFAVRANSSVKTIKEIRVTEVLDRRFAHAWLSSNQLLLMGSAGKKQAITWVRINTDKMTKEASGTLDLKAPGEKETFNSSGLLGYRKADHTLLYVYVYTPKTSKGKITAPRREGYYVAFIDAETMKVRNVEQDTRAEYISSTSFGDTRTQHTYMDEEGNFYYVACKILMEDGNTRESSSTTRQHSMIYRIKAGEDKIDTSYNGYRTERGKIIDMTWIGGDEMMLYVQDPVQATPDNPTWNSKTNRYVFFYEVANLRTGEVRKVEGMPYSVGNFAHCAAPSGPIVYLGCNAPEGTSIYLYDTRSRKVTKGAELAKGLELERIQPVARQEK